MGHKYQQEHTSMHQIQPPHPPLFSPPCSSTSCTWHQTAGDKSFDDRNDKLQETRLEFSVYTPIPHLQKGWDSLRDSLMLLTSTVLLEDEYDDDDDEDGESEEEEIQPSCHMEILKGTGEPQRPHSGPAHGQ